ncbi:MAG: nucleotidyltransferase domain-containing protein [Janthinobacterium lividum]
MQQSSIASHCDNRAVRAVIRIAFYSGMRRGEILRALPRDSVVTLSDTKNGHPRHVPIHPKIAVCRKYCPFTISPSTVVKHWMRARERGSGTGAVQRELATLSQSGLVTMKPIGNQKHYQANPDSPIYVELRAIVQKTIGLAEPLRDAPAPVGQQITAAFVYGSVAKNTDTARSDIDLMLISDDISYADVFGLLEDAGNTLGRPVNPTILTREDFAKRVADQESFLTRVLEQSKIWILGTANDLPA